MKVGLMGFGKTGKAVASILLQSQETRLQWIVRRSHSLEHRSVPEFLGIDSKEPGLIYSKEEYCADDLVRRMPVDVIIDFSSEEGISYYGKAAAEHEVSLPCKITIAGQGGQPCLSLENVYAPHLLLIERSKALRLGI